MKGEGWRREDGAERENGADGEDKMMDGGGGRGRMEIMKGKRDIVKNNEKTEVREEREERDDADPVVRDDV